MQQGSCTLNLLYTKDKSKLVTFDVIVGSYSLFEYTPGGNIKNGVLEPLSIHIVDQALKLWSVGLCLQVVERLANVSSREER